MRLFRFAWLVLLSLPVMNGTKPNMATLIPTATVYAADKGPDTSGIIALMGRFSAAHACPLAPDLILTNGHVLDIRPFDRDAALLFFRYSDGAGNYGVLQPVSTERCSDLAVMSVRPGFVVKPYPRAAEAPNIGDRVWFVGFDWSNKTKAFAERVIDARIVRIVAGHLIFDEAGEPGSSGSCVLNDRGEVLAINSFGRGVGVGDEVGGAVGIWGDLLGSCK